METCTCNCKEKKDSEAHNEKQMNWCHVIGYVAMFASFTALGAASMYIYMKAQNDGKDEECCMRVVCYQSEGVKDATPTTTSDVAPTPNVASAHSVIPESTSTTVSTSAVSTEATETTQS